MLKILVNDLVARIAKAEPQALAGVAPESAQRLVRAALRELRLGLLEESSLLLPNAVQVGRMGLFQPLSGAADAWQFSPELQPAADGSQPTWRMSPRAIDHVLVHPVHRFALLYSAKSACSTAVIWLLHTLGLADEARAYSDWPHDYRMEQLQRSPAQLQAGRLPRDQVKLLRVVRDPLDRAASSFRHAVGTQYAVADIKASLGIDIESQGLSFQQFIDFLESEDLDRCNPHHRRQKNPLEAVRAADFIINASRQDLFAGLNAFERTMGMPITDFAALSWIHELQSTRVPHSVDMGPDPDRLVLTMRQARRGPWPKGLLTPTARARLEKLYAEDIALYANVPPLI